MIKLQDLINELDKPQDVYSPGEGPETDSFSKQGFRLKGTTVDPKTGTSSSTVEYEPDIKKIARSLEKYRDEFRIVSKSNVSDIKELAENINVALHRIAKATYRLNEMIQYNKKYKNA